MKSIAQNRVFVNTENRPLSYTKSELLTVQPQAAGSVLYIQNLALTCFIVASRLEGKKGCDYQKRACPGKGG